MRHPPLQRPQPESPRLFPDTAEPPQSPPPRGTEVFVRFDRVLGAISSSPHGHSTRRRPPSRVTFPSADYTLLRSRLRAGPISYLAPRALKPVRFYLPKEGTVLIMRGTRALLLSFFVFTLFR